MDHRGSKSIIKVDNKVQKWCLILSKYIIVKEQRVDGSSVVIAR